MEDRSQMNENTSYKKEKKFIFNNQYYTISIFTIVTVLICAVLIKALFMWGVTSAWLGSIIKWSVPYWLGMFIALLLFPLVKLVERTVFGHFNMKDKARRAASVLLIFVAFAGILTIGFCFIIPQIADSVSTLTELAPRWYNQVMRWVTQWNVAHPDMNMDFLTGKLEEFGKNLFTSSKLQAQLQTYVIKIFSASLSIVAVVVDAFITIVVSIYLLLDTESFRHGVQRIMHALFSEESVDQINRVSGECYSIFNKYVSGKILDSLIIGILCFIAMSILRLPYALVISVIVGITNMIPYFGPYIGAIPGAFIMLMVSPMKVLIYLIMILVLQQFDGLILGPKILGDSTGLGPAWIIFSVSAGGAICGVLGMFVGVPVVAMIGHVIGVLVDYRLDIKKKRGEIQPEELVELKSAEVQRAEEKQAKELRENNLKGHGDENQKPLEDDLFEEE